MKTLTFNNRDIDIELTMERQPNGLYGYQRKMTGPRIKGDFVSKFTANSPRLAREGSFNYATSMLKHLDKDATHAMDYDGDFSFTDMKKDDLANYCHENGLECMNGAHIAIGNDGGVWMVPLALSPEEWIGKYWGKFIQAENESYVCVWETVRLVDLSSFDGVISKYGLDAGAGRDIYITDRDFYSIHAIFDADTGYGIVQRTDFSDIKPDGFDKK